MRNKFSWLGLIIIAIGLIFFGILFYNFICLIHYFEIYLNACAVLKYDIYRIIMPMIIVGFICIVIGLIFILIESKKKNV